ncbi:MAG: metallophosphoesterase [Pyrobaculum sp.]
MYVGIISDTHDDWLALRAAGRKFAEKGVELVIHAGDWTSPFSMLKLRRALGPGPRIVTVFGNNDGDRYNFAKRAQEAGVDILGEAGLVEVGGVKIGVYHGTSELLVEAAARSGMFDVLVYGHTHRIDVRRVNGALVINPGEACGCATEKKTAALLNIKTLEVDVLEL